jgi:hypothetical protein
VLAWTDDFFERQDDTVAVFDYDLKILKKIIADERLDAATMKAPSLLPASRRS